MFRIDPDSIIPVVRLGFNDKAIHAIDRLVRKTTDVFEFCNKPDCIFRVSTGCASYPLRLRNGEIPAGVKVLHLHFWNEHMPAMPADVPVIGPAVRLRRQVASSAHYLAKAMKNDPRLAGAEAVGGVTPLFTPGDGSAAERIFLRLGFFVTPHKNPQGRFMEFWEKVYAWLLIWAFTEKNQPRPLLRGLRRSDFWMSAEDFRRLYGGESRHTGADGSSQGRVA
jgi:hypothetical protein